MRKRAKIIPFPGCEPVAAATPLLGDPRRPSRPGDERSFVEVHRCDQSEALVVRSLFDSEGIPAVFRSRLAVSVHPFTVGDQGAVVVLVPASEAQHSRILLARILRTWGA